MSPTQRSLKHLRSQFYQCAIVEKRIPHVNVTRDCFGADILACRTVPKQEIVLVQATSKTNLAARERKVRGNPDVWGWIRSGGRFLLHGWDGSQLTEREIAP